MLRRDWIKSVVACLLLPALPKDTLWVTEVQIIPREQPVDAVNYTVNLSQVKSCESWYIGLLDK